MTTCRLVRGRIRIRGEQGWEGQFGPLEEFVQLGNRFYSREWIQSAMGVPEDIISLVPEETEQEATTYSQDMASVMEALLAVCDDLRDLTRVPLLGADGVSEQVVMDVKTLDRLESAICGLLERKSL